MVFVGSDCWFGSGWSVGWTDEMDRWMGYLWFVWIYKLNGILDWNLDHVLGVHWL
ncbi:hypothetical protein BDV36DRAFT_271592 [Aspergillus pseudocaelatus]|uniref:Uncharacterized protein n=1 Tax=Aspergillus pseudocaelatus TaxID=1825620 RepID=A0ABQ6W5L8_9EURO|nr:hypothetical protein BDV36DRAFT_271592 [Aspergillus pseudocaelatus]